MDEDTIQQDAKVLERALRNMAADGHKLLAVSYNYPKGMSAWMVGFFFTWGAVTAGSILTLTAVAISKVLQ